MSATRPRPGARRAERTRRVGGDRTTVAAVAVLVAAVGLVVVATDAVPTSAPVGPRVDAAAAAPYRLVERTLLGCPDSSALRTRRRDGVRSTVGAGLAPLTTPGGTVPGGGTLRRGIGETIDVRERLARGDLRELPAESASVVTGEGAAAVGLFAHRVDREAGSSEAAALAECAEPRGSWWFTGAGGGLDHGSDLVISNLDPGPAVVDVRLLGREGEVDVAGTRGIPLGAGETRTLAMQDLAPQADELVVEVRSSRGRVVAAVLDRFAPGPSAAQGVEWLPGTEQPARDLVLGGVVARAEARTLLVGNPSQRQALVQVRLAGETGTFSPTGLDTLSVAPGAVGSLDLTAVVPPGEPVAVRVRSEVPVVAGVRSTTRRGAGDTGYAGPVFPLTGPAAVPVLGGARTTVQLTAGTRPARVRVTGYTAAGRRTGADVVRVDATATAAWQPEPTTAYVVVSPVSGQVRGAATYAGPDGTTQAPLVDLPLTRRLPRVLPGPLEAG